MCMFAKKYGDNFTVTLWTKVTALHIMMYSKVTIVKGDNTNTNTNM